MKKNGFTLIELLAVIIILAVVALIATPIVLNVVNDAKKSAAKSEANMIISGIQTGCATRDMQSQMTGSTVTKCTVGALEADEIGKMVSLGSATATGMTIDATNKVTAGVIVSNGHTITITAGVASEPIKN